MIRATTNLQLGNTDGHRHQQKPCIRSAAEIARIREAGFVVRKTLDAMAEACRPGITTAELDEIAAEEIAAASAEPLFLGRQGPLGEFPAVTCISIEDELTHGVPSERALRDGEIVSIDCGVRLNGWCADAAMTVPVGNIDFDRRELIESNESLLWMAIRMIRPGRRWSEIAQALQDMAFDAGYGIVEEFTGHGIGRQLHESPAVPSAMTAGLQGRGDFTLRPGMVLALEPMLIMRGAALRGDGTAAGVPIYTSDDGWTVRTLMGEVASHFEHTVVVTSGGSEVLTGAEYKPAMLEGPKIPGFSWGSGS
ncbi:MAG: type I methionyl aminopeptidase [Phycisphaerales bacterium]|nr:type I methionyl aminopeptidase [Phycisphaerales bacterium]